MQKRLDSLRRGLDHDEAILVTSRENMRYLSGFGGEGKLVITRTRCLLITDFRYIVDAKKAYTSFEVVDISEEQAQISLLGIKKFYIEESISYGAYLSYRKKFEETTFESDAGRIDALRIIKTEEELSYIQTAAGIGCAAFEEVLNDIQTGMTEKAVAAELEYRMRKLGGEGTSFDTIVASGKNSAIPHAVPGDRELQRGDFVTIDFGCLYNGYCSDMTRTFVLGEASERHREIYHIVLNAQFAALDGIKAGMKCSEADSIARDMITKAGYGKQFGHSLGHGVGLMIHEEPRLSPKCDIILEENMVVTVEPGIYIEGFGGVRIEDLVVITNNKPNILTTVKKDLLIL